MANIFISYSMINQVFVRTLVADLKKTTHQVWVDTNIKGGKDWAKVIDQKLDEADVVIICLAKSAIHHDFFREQVVKIVEKQKFFIPILLEGSFSDFKEIPEFAQLFTKHAIYFSKDYHLAFEELLSSIPNLPKIFISYRRDDSADICGRIYDTLVQHFGKEKLIRDINDISLGIDFRAYLQNIIRECVIQLVIIGPQWVDIQDKNTGKKRLENPADFVRIEVETALSRNLYVIPVLVSGATLPTEEQLPESLGNLVFRNGMNVRRDPDYSHDMNSLIQGIEKIFSQLEQ